LAIGSAVLCVAVVGLSLVSGLGPSRGPRLIAFPSTVPEAEVLRALEDFGIGDAIGASTTPVPLSDFSRVGPVPFSDAAARSPAGDPRRTPLLDELEGRFTTGGPAGSIWRVVYLPRPSPARDEAASLALSSIGCAWAWDRAGERGSTDYIWLPALAWAIWLLWRRPGRRRLARALLSLSLSPLLYLSTLASALLFVALEAAVMIAYPIARSGDRKRLPRELWPYAVAAVSLLALDPGALPAAALSLGSLMAVALLIPRVEGAVIRRRLHEPPVFRPLTTAAYSMNARGIARAIALPSALIIAVFAVSPEPTGLKGLTGPTRTGARTAASHRIERERSRPDYDASTMLREHKAFQAAITFGRIGDASWGESSYAPAYRYVEESGRLRRSPGDDAVGGAPETGSEPIEGYETALSVLASPRPGPVF